jgi:hypothetical protein
MEILTALIRTRYFPKRIKARTELLKLYATDYADRSLLLLEHLGHHRYCQLYGYVSGSTEPNKLIDVLEAKGECSFFCNENRIGITPEVCTQATTNPHDYELALYKCFK